MLTRVWLHLRADVGGMLAGVLFFLRKIGRV